MSKVRELSQRTHAQNATTKVSIVNSSTNSSLPEDDRLAITQTLAGYLNAFNALVTKYQGLAYSIAFRMLQTRDAAADAVQESFLKAFRAVSSFHGSSFKSWLARIVVNTCYDMLRLNRYLTIEVFRDEPENEAEIGGSRLLHDTYESPQAFVERMELSAQIEIGVRSLPYEQRLVLILSDIHGYRYDEISEITGMPMGTVKSRISRARLKLRDFLLQQDVLPAEFALQTV